MIASYESYLVVAAGARILHAPIWRIAVQRVVYITLYSAQDVQIRIEGDGQLFAIRIEIVYLTEYCVRPSILYEHQVVMTFETHLMNIA